MPSLARLAAWWTRRLGRARGLAVRADTARDLGRHADAAALYREVLAVAPDWPAMHIQAGHMQKEAGFLVAAEAHYRRAEALTPNDPDLALQIGHLHKVAGRPGAAAEAYRRALGLGVAEARRELEALGDASTGQLPR